MVRRGGALLKSLGPILVVFLSAAGAFSLLGSQGELLHDPAVYVYGGQRMLDGVPPYVSIFDAKAPFGTMLCAVGIGVGRWLGIDDLQAARAFFFLISCACVVAVYLLSLRLFASRWQAVLTGAVFIAFRGFGVHALNGPLPKSAAVLFVTLAMVLSVERRWFWAGLCAALAGITWQPTGIYALAMVSLAWLQSDTRVERRRAVASAASGVLLPLVGLALYFTVEGALFDLVDAAVLYPFLFHVSPGGLGVQIARFTNALAVGYGGGGVVIAVGLFMIGPIYAWRLHSVPAPRLGNLSRDRFAVVLLTFPLPFAWSLFDFQAYPDLFIFLPYASLGFGWVLALGLDAVADRIGLEARGQHVLGTATAVLIVLWSAKQYSVLEVSRRQLPAQRSAVSRIVAEHGADARVLAIGAPQALVLLGRANPTRYGLGLRRSIVRHIEARHPGGFAGWLASLRDYDPEVVILDSRSAMGLDDEERRIWQEWKRGYRRSAVVGELRVAVPRRP